jgi:hypothetical protein
MGDEAGSGLSRGHGQGARVHVPKEGCFAARNGLAVGGDHTTHGRHGCRDLPEQILQTAASGALHHFHQLLGLTELF